MPPCAHTECERLTGTIENRSTLPPASAILMTADKPASPPPTTMILGTAAMLRSLSSARRREPSEVTAGARCLAAHSAAPVARWCRTAPVHCCPAADHYLPGIAP